MGLLPPKVLVVAKGEFVCPNCRESRRYIHKEIVERRLFYFVPFLGEKIDEYVKCEKCRARHPVSVLRQKLHAASDRMIRELQKQLADGMSIEEAENKLESTGMTVSDTKQYISVAAGIGRRRCPECSLTYWKNVTHCPRCSHALPESASLINPK